MTDRLSHRLCILSAVLVTVLLFAGSGVRAASPLIEIATTTITVSICGDGFVDGNEDCDSPGETGVYSTSIAGRQCTVQCLWGPYCGDSILHAGYGEECDDGNNVSGDFCTADCKNEYPQSGGGGGAPSGGGGGGGSSGGGDTPTGDTQVSIEGKAYPHSNVNILRDGRVIGVVRANSKAEFFFNSNTEPGTATFGFWATDDSGLRSIAFNATFDVIEGAVTNVSGIFLPPTIDVDRDVVQRGEIINISGQTVPDVDVDTHINSSHEIIERVLASDAGDWALAFNTARIDEDVHTAKARFEIFEGGKRTESNFSQSVTFFVGVSPDAIISSSDLNRDGFVNLIDFSILIFWWGTNGGTSDPPADINGNGTVGIEDFSVMLFNWTG